MPHRYGIVPRARHPRNPQVQCCQWVMANPIENRTNCLELRTDAVYCSPMSDLIQLRIELLRLEAIEALADVARSDAPVSDRIRAACGVLAGPRRAASRCS